VDKKIKFEEANSNFKGYDLKLDPLFPQAQVTEMIKQKLFSSPKVPYPFLFSSILAIPNVLVGEGSRCVARVLNEAGCEGTDRANPCDSIACWLPRLY
jgi:hypothetical protein